MNERPLTAIAHDALCEVLHGDDRAIDATVGNGHDTLFLAGRVGPHGHVIGFDIQPAALAAARSRLSAAGLDANATLLACGHERLGVEIPPDWVGTVAAVMFNLGYLPGGDKGLITRADTTLAALRQALPVLRIGGLISLMVYPGHPGADAEVRVVDDWLAQIGDQYRVTCHASPGPNLYLIERLR